MMYGHVDNPAHWLKHLRTLADIQRRTGGFTEFVALPSSTPARRSTSPGSPAQDRHLVTTAQSMQWRGSSCVG
jgi:FO synthase